MKKETRNRIIKWSIYGVLVIATVLIFLFSTGIFGRDYHKVVDESGVWNGKMEWTDKPMFYEINTGQLI